MRLKIPSDQASGPPPQDMAYLFKPEIHLQLEGESDVRLTNGSMLLRSEEMAIVPALVPHRVDMAAAGGRRMVIGFYSTAVSIHYARSRTDGYDSSEAMGFYETKRLRQFVDLAELLIEYHSGRRPHGMAAEHTLSLALLWLLIDLLDDEVPETSSDSNKLFQVKWLVHSHLSNPDLSVKFLAEQLRCSPGYLSHLFGGESEDGSLIQYIHQQRVSRAIEALASNRLSISEIAWACGFADPGYFSRIFRKQTGMTPQAYRKKLEDEARLGFDE